MSKNNDIVISVKKISKSFKLPHQKTDSFKGMFVSMFRGGRSYERQRVLRNVSFDVKRGEFLGIVGRNGGGKSTLLKLLAEIYAPDDGEIQINGDLTPFIELGVGFNPELTGRENVYLNGALLGFDRKAMDKLYNGIVEFAELEKFMDQKLKNYSSGMQVRLAFSVAIQARTDILLIDEVLAVGDANFQKKCFDVFESFKQEGRTVIFISHSMQQVIRFCDRVILLDKGRIRTQGDPEVVAAEYDMLNSEEQKDNVGRLEIKNPREAHIVEAVLSNFNRNDILVEIGSANGRHVSLINSFNVETYGLDPSLSSVKKDNKLYRKLSELESTDSVSGLLLLDNQKTINLPYLRELFQELNEGKLIGVGKIYVHLPFHEFQAYNKERNPQSSPHLGDPLNIATVASMLQQYHFALTQSSLYGTDQPKQYAEAVFERFDNRKKELVWGSLES